jgi:hypothetical protein
MLSQAIPEILRYVRIVLGTVHAVDSPLKLRDRTNACGSFERGPPLSIFVKPPSDDGTERLVALEPSSEFGSIGAASMRGTRRRRCGREQISL